MPTHTLKPTPRIAENGAQPMAMTPWTPGPKSTLPHSSHAFRLNTESFSGPKRPICHHSTLGAGEPSAWAVKGRGHTVFINCADAAPEGKEGLLSVGGMAKLPSRNRQEPMGTTL